MKMRTKDDLLSILDLGQPPCVTLTLPTHRTSPENEQDPIRFKNLLKEASRGLESFGMKSADAEELLTPARDLVDEFEFWQHTDRGIAAFLCKGVWEVECVAMKLPEVVRVGNTFAIYPLLSLLKEVPDYLVLAATYDDVRLYRGDRFGLEVMSETELPKDMRKLTAMSDIESGVHFHPSGPTATTGGTPTPKYHSLGPSAQDEKTKLKQRFAADLANAMDGFLAKRNYPPFVLIADEALAGAYGSAAKSAPLASSDTHVNPGALEANALYALAYPIVAESSDATDDVVGRFNSLWHDTDDDKAMIDADEICQAAENGRVDTLLVVQPCNQPDRDTLEQAVRHVLLNGGALQPVPAEALPNGSTAAAILRY